jgi:hypothetical protein
LGSGDPGQDRVLIAEEVAEGLPLAGGPGDVVRGLLVGRLGDLESVPDVVDDGGKPRI